MNRVPTNCPVVVGVTRRDELSLPTDIEILSGQGSVLAGLEVSEETLNLAIEELRQEIAEKSPSARKARQ